MQKWQDQYRARLTTPEEAVRSVPPGDAVYVSGNAATPRALCRALAEHARRAPGLRVAHVLLLGEDPFEEATRAGHLRHLSWFVGPADRRALLEDRGDYVPCHLSEIPALIRAGRPRIGTALLSVAPPDHHGMMSLGVEVLASLAAAECAERVIVQVNPRMPRVLGTGFLHLDEVDAVVEVEEELPELPPAEPSAVELAIARHVLSLVPDGATLQLGIGGIPDAVVSLLGERRDLGIHSEMISDGVMRAYEAGVLSGRHKTRHRRKIVTTFAMGSRALYDWLHENSVVEAHPVDHTNDPLSASQNDRLVSINSALSVDVTGQVNADSIGDRIYSGVGGQVDFVRAASLSRGGVSIIALPSTAREGRVSRIVTRLAAGAGVVTSRADVRYVVTEHGVADLWGADLDERARQLVAIAHPDFRAGLVEDLRGRERMFQAGG